jgi:hypothetical protein
MTTVVVVVLTLTILMNKDIIIRALIKANHFMDFVENIDNDLYNQAREYAHKIDKREYDI